MSWSLGETRTLALKAARGAGFSWGLAEEAGAAVASLQASGLPGAAALAELLELMDRDDVKDCPLTLGAAISDGAVILDHNRTPNDLGPLRQPMLLVPFLWRFAPARLSWGQAVVMIGAGGGRGGANTSSSRHDLLRDGVSCELVRKQTEPVPPNPASRTPESEAPSIAALRRFASRILAPATEASRITGAGAGLKDND